MDLKSKCFGRYFSIAGSVGALEIFRISVSSSSVDHGFLALFLTHLNNMLFIGKREIDHLQLVCDDRRTLGWVLWMKLSRKDICCSLPCTSRVNSILSYMGMHRRQTVTIKADSR